MTTTSTPPNPKLTAILAAARETFARKGFAAARLEDIAQAAGVGKGTIYLHFENKQALFEGVVRGFVLSEFNAAEAMLESYEGSSEDIIRVMLSTIGTRLIESDLREIVRLVIAEGAAFPEVTAFYHREVISRGMAMVRRIVARGVARGEFRPNAVETFPQLVVAPMIMGAIWRSLLSPYEHLETSALIEAHLDTLFNGLRRVP